MKCIILSAGFGTLSCPITRDTTKSLLPVRGKPVIAHIIEKVQAAEGVDEIFIVSNQRFFSGFKQWLDNFPVTVPVKIINNGTLNCKNSLGAVKSLAFAIDSCNIDDDLLVIGGANLFSFSLDEFIESSLKMKPNPTIGVYNLNGRYKAKKYGVVKLNEKGKVIDFYEKPSGPNGKHLISLCLYYLPKETLSTVNTYLNAIPSYAKASEGRRNTQRPKEVLSIPEGYTIRDKNNSIGNYIKWLVKQRQVQSFNFEGDWFDVSDTDSYAEAVCLF